MSNSVLTATAQEAVEGYAERLGELISACAEHQRRDPEAFLWNARRALEAICHILLSVHLNRPSDGKGDGKAGGKGDSKDNTLDGLIQRLRESNLLEKQRYIQVDKVREYTNLGVHIRQPWPEDLDVAMTEVPPTLAHLLVWIVQASPAAGWMGTQEKLLDDAEVIRKGGSTAPSPSELLVGAYARIAELEGQLRIQEGATRARARPDRTAPGVRRKTDPSPWKTLLVGAVLGSGLLGLIGVGLYFWMVAPTPERGAHASAAVPAPAPAPAPAAPVVPACPAGMTRIAASQILLGQPVPPRKGWDSAHASPLKRLDVASYCIDEKPRTRAAFRGWSGSEAVVSQSCDWRTSGEGEAAPVVCVDGDHAAAYCESIGAALPSIAQWEALMRSSEKDLAHGGITSEWAGDLSPPAVLNLRPEPCDGPRCQEHIFRQFLPAGKTPDPDGNLLLSWSRQEVGNRWANLGFRCASK